MKNANKIIVALLLINLFLVFSVLLVNMNNFPPFLDNREETMFFSRGITYAHEDTESYRELYTIESNWNGIYTLYATITSDSIPEIFKTKQSLYFWKPNLFSTRDVMRSKSYTAQNEPDVSEAHLIDGPVEQFFKTVYEDDSSFCYTSLLTRSVQCVSAGH